MHWLNLDVKPFRTTEILFHLFAAHKQNIAGVITVIHANFLRFNVNMCFTMLFSRTAFESIKCYFPVVQQYIIVSRHFSGIFNKRVFLAHSVLYNVISENSIREYKVLFPCCSTVYYSFQAFFPVFSRSVCFSHTARKDINIIKKQFFVELYC